MPGTEKKAKGTGDVIKGKVQAATGELTGNQELKAKGKANKTKGKGKVMAGRVQNAVDEVKS